MSMLNHPNIIQIYEVFEVGKFFQFFVFPVSFSINHPLIFGKLCFFSEQGQDHPGDGVRQRGRVVRLREQEWEFAGGRGASNFPADHLRRAVLPQGKNFWFENFLGIATESDEFFGFFQKFSLASFYCRIRFFR